MTVAGVTEESFSVSIIPHTLGETVLGEKKANDVVNLENDIIGKYVERLMEPRETEKAESAITKDFLLRAGF